MPFISINTPNSPDFRYFPISKSRITFSVKASHDARIALRTHLREDSNVYEITIGCWGNSACTIKKNNVEPNVAEVDTMEILTMARNSDFWIRWACDGLLSVGREDDEALISYKDREPFIINYIGFGTAWGATGEWVIEESPCTSPAVRQELAETCHLWQDYNESKGLPRNAVAASEDGLYVGRSHHRESVVPGGIKDEVCTIAWGGAAHEKKEFQVLCGVEVSWVKSWDGSVPLHAPPAGETEDGYALFIGRVFYAGFYHVGKIQPNHQICYIAVNGQETPCADYETLVIDERSNVDCIER